MAKPSRLLIVGLGLALVCATLVHAQEIWIGGGFNRFSARFGKLEDFDGSFLYCRGFYGSGRGGGGWTTDYPGADHNFSVRLAELTRVTVKFDVNRQPYHVVVRLDDPSLLRCPMLFMDKRREPPVHRVGGDRATRLSGQGRVPVGGRFLGQLRVAELGERDLPRAAAGAVSHFRHPHLPSDHAHRV